jgi:hypothetical protein
VKERVLRKVFIWPAILLIMLVPLVAQSADWICTGTFATDGFAAFLVDVPTCPCYDELPPGNTNCMFSAYYQEWDVGPGVKGTFMNDGVSKDFPYYQLTGIICHCTLNGAHTTYTCDDVIETEDINLCRACAGTG